MTARVFDCVPLEQFLKNLLPGTIVQPKDFTVVCGDGACIRFTEIQAEGGKRMSTEDYLRGRAVQLLLLYSHVDYFRCCTC